MQHTPVNQKSSFLLSPSQLNTNQSIYYSTTNGIKVYQNDTSPLTKPSHNENPENMNILCHEFKDREEYQGLNLGNGDTVNIPSCKNVNVTKYAIFNNIKIKKEDTKKWAINNFLKQMNYT